MATLVGTLSLAWEVSAERVLEELERERLKSTRPIPARQAARFASPMADDAAEMEVEGVLSLDGWKRRKGRRRRTRVDQRGGRGACARGGRAA